MNIYKKFTEKTDAHKATIIQVVLSLLGTLGFSYVMKLSGSEIFSFSAFTVIIPIGFYRLLERAKKELNAITDPKKKKRRICFVALVSFLFSISMIMGYQLQKNGMMDYGIKGKGMILVRGAFLSIPVFPFVNLLFQGIDKWLENTPTYKSTLWKTKKVFFGCWAAIFLCWIPVWLAYYPTVMSYDFHRQAQEAMNGFAYFNPHHPLAHTWLIWLFLHIGEAIGSFETGLALFEVFQMLVSSVVMAYSCSMLYRVVKRKWAVVLAVLFYGIFPFVSVSVMCTTKDILFSAFFMLFVLLLIERTFLTQGKRKNLIDVFCVLAGILMILFRNNAFYAMLVASVFWVIFAKKKERIRLLIMCLLIVIGGKGGMAGIRAAVGTHFNASFGEMLSVPVQQFARVGNMYGDNLDDETFAIVDRYINNQFWQQYMPGLSDPMKSNATFYTVWEKDWGQVFSDWLKIGMQYPNEYIDAFMMLTRGYWFLDDTSFAEIMGSGVEGRMGAIYTYNSSAGDAFEGVEHVSRFPWLEGVLEEIVSANQFYDWPVISILFKAATYCWILVLTFIIALYGKQKKQALLCLYPLLYFGTCLLGPIVQLRYIFPFIVLAPIFVVFPLLTKEKEATAEQELAKAS